MSINGLLTCVNHVQSLRFTGSLFVLTASLSAVAVVEDVTIKSIVLYLSFLLGSLGSRGASGGFFPLSARL